MVDNCIINQNRVARLPTSELFFSCLSLVHFVVSTRIHMLNLGQVCYRLIFVGVIAKFQWGRCVFTGRTLSLISIIENIFWALLPAPIDRTGTRYVPYILVQPCMSV